MSKETLKEVLEASELIPALWAEKYSIKNESGFPLDFDTNHRFMRQPFNDMSQFQAWLKPPQIGATTTQILKALYIAKKKNKQIIYTLPTAGDVYEMVGGSFNRLIAQNPILREWVRDGDTTAHKFVGNGLIRFRGTFTDKQAMMYPSDLNMHDEVDASDPSVITLMETRLQAKADGMRWYWSHPTLAGHGIDQYWQQSDKKEWFITCTHCNKRQILTWPDSIDDVLKAYVCTTCHLPLSDEDRIMGEWMATSTGKFSGYHISQMMYVPIKASSILEAKADPMKDEQYFYNYVLGLPYAEGQDRISPETILKNVHADINQQDGQIIIGVDTGLPIYYTIMNKQGVFNFGTCKQDNPYADLERLLLRWPRAIIVSDQGGDLIGIRQLQQKYPGRVFLVYYRKDRKTTEVAKWNEDGSVVVDRNRMMTLMIDQLREPQRIRLNGSVEEWKPFAKHFGNIYRVKEETPFGMEYKWERNGPDHFVHAMLYAMVGYDRFAEQEAAIIQNNDWMDEIPKGQIISNYD